MTLTPEQKQTVSSWVAAGDNLSTVQKKLSEHFQLSLTYMDVRFLVDDLGLELKNAAPKTPTDIGKAAPANPASGPTAATEKLAGGRSRRRCGRFRCPAGWRRGQNHGGQRHAPAQRAGQRHRHLQRRRHRQMDRGQHGPPRHDGNQPARLPPLARRCPSLHAGTQRRAAEKRPLSTIGLPLFARAQRARVESVAQSKVGISRIPQIIVSKFCKVVAIAIKGRTMASASLPNSFSLQP